MFAIRYLLISYPDAEVQIGYSGFIIPDGRRPGPGIHFITFSHQNLVKKDWVKGISRCIGRPAKNRLVKVFIHEALTNGYVDPKKPLVKPPDPYALKKQWRVKAQRPFHYTF
jgi:hypothetical protein